MAHSDHRRPLRSLFCQSAIVGTRAVSLVVSDPDDHLLHLSQIPQQILFVVAPAREASTSEDEDKQTCSKTAHSQVNDRIADQLAWPVPCHLPTALNANHLLDSLRLIKLYIRLRCPSPEREDCRVLEQQQRVMVAADTAAAASFRDDDSEEEEEEFEEVVKEITFRHTKIKNAIEWRRFLSGG